MDSKHVFDDEPWVELFRPKVLDEVFDNENVLGTIKKMVSSKSLCHMIMYGPSGTGKTSTIKSAANEIYGTGPTRTYMVLEMNASAERGIDSIRNRVNKFVTVEPVFHKTFSDNKETLKKLVVLDEADAMTEDAQESLRIIMETYINDASFCLICNYIVKIHEAIRSRCVKFKFTPISALHMKNKINEICEKKQISITKDGIQTLIFLAHGDMRFILNHLQSMPDSKEPITSDFINKQLGYPTTKQIDTIYDAINNKKMKESVGVVRKIVKKYGLSVINLLTELHLRVLNDKKIDDATRILRISNLARIEVLQANNTNEHIQLVGMISCLKL